MSIIGSVAKGIGAGVTLGGSHKLKLAQNRYQETYADYIKAHDNITAVELATNQSLTKLGQVIEDVQPALKASQRILRVRTDALAHKNSNAQTREKIAAFRASYNSAVSAGFGGLVGGGATAAGAWALVGFAGSASTGFAISGLSGAAAYNATLAWFGGGALAAGGAGMSGGMMVLGGIVAAPMIYFATKKAYAKAKETDQKNETLKFELQKINKLTPKAIDYRDAAADCLRQVDLISRNYIQALEAFERVLHPLGLLSRLKQNALRVINRAYTGDTQKTALNELRNTTNAFLENFAHSTQTKSSASDEQMF